MKTDRRTFLQIIGGALAFALGRPAPARAQPGALEIHRATRNTLRGAIGATLRRLGGKPAPFKHYPSAQRIALPPAVAYSTASLAQVVRAGAPAAGFRDAPLSLAELSLLLHLANGVTGRRGETLLRAAPSAGALYAGEVYVLAERVSGLPPGAYYYAVADHALLRLRSRSSGSLAHEVAQAVERPGEIENAPAVVLLTNVFRRYTWKYANRGYRYALIDSGHIGENLRLGALSLGLGERAVLRFHDDRLNALLEVDGRDEAVCAVHLVGRPAEATPSPAPRVRRLVEKGSAEDRPFRGGAIERYHRATQLVEAPATGPRAVHAPEVARPAPPSLPLPEASDSATPLDASIRERRSALRFRDEPISLAELSFVLEMAGGHAGLRRAPGVELHLVVHRVDDLAPGLYRYEPRGHGLSALRVGDLRQSMVDACLHQEKAGSAAVAIAMVGRIGSQAARAGARSYRDLTLESGAIGERIYLGAEAVGLAARNLAAFLDDELDALLGLDGADAAVTHLTMVGRGS